MDGSPKAPAILQHLHLLLPILRKVFDGSSISISEERRKELKHSRLFKKHDLAFNSFYVAIRAQIHVRLTMKRL